MNTQDSVLHRVEFLKSLNLNCEFTGRILDSKKMVNWTKLLGKAVSNLAAITVLSPIPEVKIGSALALYEVVEVYVSLLKRLDELQINTPKREVKDPVDSYNNPWLSPQEVRVQLLEPVLNEMNETLCELNRLAEWPTVRIIERNCRPSLETAIGIIQDQEEIPLNIAELAYMGARDNRFVTFNHTRDYLEETSIEKKDPTTDLLVAQLRTQRDELDAIETFARLAAASAIPPEMLLELARVIADEARHSLIGELGLLKLGLNPFQIPIGTIGAELRGSMNPWEGLAQICLIGETGNLKNIGKGSSDAISLNNRVISESLQAVYYDERYHIAFGTKLLLEKFPHKTPKKIQEESLSLTNQFLKRRGVSSVTMSNVGSVLGE